jgi:3-oxoacyl-[acyl-carrier protein] reductase
MADRLQGRIALITGGSRGIGAAIGRALAAEGAALALVHLGDAANAAVLVAEIGDGRAQAYECDVADPDAVATAIARAEAEIGPADILVNCAGIVDETPFEAMTLETWDRMIAVHLRGTFLMCHAVYPAMKERGFGRIINFASQVAYKGMKGLTHYRAAKAGIIGLTRALALEAAAHGVTVNAIAPGPTDTDILLGMSPDWRAGKMAELPIGRFAQPAEIAPTAVLLASADGAFYVGQTLSPNGGDVML